MRPAMFVLLLGACGGSTPAPAKPPPPARAPAAPVVFRFDWSPPCRVPVTERSFRKGHEVVMRYAVDVTRIGATELKVDLVDVDVVELDGTDLRRPEYAAVRDQVRDLLAAFPALIVDHHGNHVRTESLDEIIALTTANSPQVAGAFTSPELRAEMAVKFAEPWLTWVGHWVEWSLAPGQSWTSTLTAPGPSGDEIPYDARVEHLGVSDGVAHLRYTERMEGAALKARAEPLLRSMSGVAPDPAEAEKAFAEMTFDGYRESSYEVETTPANLRPRRARQEMRIEMTVNGERSRHDREWREFAFDWARAVGCGT